MTVCTTCGMKEDANAAHGKDYSGAGKHDYVAAAETAKSLSSEPLILTGGCIKAVDGQPGHFTGYLVRFSDADTPDLVGDYFTKSTELYLENETIIPLLYDHGLNATLKGRKIGRAKVKYDDVGLFIQGELDVADKYVEAIYDKLVVAGKAGLSSGAAPHMIERKSVREGISEMLRWGIAEGSVTPAATEPQNKAQVETLKSYIDNRAEDPLEAAFKSISDTLGAGVSNTVLKDKAKDETAPVVEKKSIADRPMKGVFEEELAAVTPSVWQLRDALCEVCKDIAAAAETVDISGGAVDVDIKVREAVTEYAARLIPLIVAQIKEYLDNDQHEYPFYLRSFDLDKIDDLQSFLSVKSALVTGARLDEHSTKVVSAAGEFKDLVKAFGEGLALFVKRAKDKAEFRANTKAGRMFSAANLAKIKDIHGQMGDAITGMSGSHTQLSDLLSLAEPGDSDGKSVTEADRMQVRLILARHRTESVSSAAAAV